MCEGRRGPAHDSPVPARPTTATADRDALELALRAIDTREPVLLQQPREKFLRRILRFLWRVTAASQTLDLSEQWMVVDWMSYLQKVGIAFEHIQIGQAALVPVKHPVDRQGQPLPKPDIFPDWKQRTLVMKGPLRVLQSLDGLHMPVRWRRLSLSIDRQAPQALNRSALTLELVGEMFESRMH